MTILCILITFLCSFMLCCTFYAILLLFYYYTITLFDGGHCGWKTCQVIHHISNDITSFHKYSYNIHVFIETIKKASIRKRNVRVGGDILTIILTRILASAFKGLMDRSVKVQLARVNVEILWILCCWQHL